MRVVSNTDAKTVFACGCIVEKVETPTRTLAVTPCSLTCEAYVLVMGEIERSGKPVTEIDAR